MNVLIVGAGAVGALFGSALARQGARVSVVCRSDYDAVSRDGYDIRSKSFGDHRFRPEHVYRSVEDCREPPDYLLLTSKVLESVDRATLIRPAVGPRTVIVLIQNGVDIEPPIAAAFPDNELLSSLAFVAVGRGAPGQVNHLSLGSLILVEGLRTAYPRYYGIIGGYWGWGSGWGERVRGGGPGGGK